MEDIAMVNDAPPAKLLCQDMLCKLGSDLVLEDGSILPKGSVVLLLPQTISDCVLMPDGKSLYENWPTVSKVGHEHVEDQTNLTEFSRQLINFSTRLAKVEETLSLLAPNISGESNE